MKDNNNPVESQPAIFMEMEGFFDLTEEEQREHIKVFLQLLSPNSEVRRRAQQKADEA
jgi:hypothetical protein